MAQGATLPRAVQSSPWPGDAALEISHVWLHRGKWEGEQILDGNTVTGITPFLHPREVIGGKPYRLVENSGKSFNGCKAYGQGFLLTPATAADLIQKNPLNRRVLFPYLIGDDLNSSPDQQPSRWVINFHDWPLDSSSSEKGPSVEHKAADFPECLEIVRANVKPVRDELGDTPDARRLKQFWWQFGRARPELYTAIAGLQRVLVRALTSKHHGLLFVPTGWVYDQTVPVIASDKWEVFTVMQSDLHYKWSLEYGNKLETRPQYTTSDCFEPFPFPRSSGDLCEQAKTITYIAENSCRSTLKD